MTRSLPRALMGFDGDKRRRMTPAEDATLRLVKMSFREFLRFWQFKNRETGAIETMAELWAGLHFPLPMAWTR